MRPNLMVGAICVVSVAAFAACQPSQPLDASSKNAAPLRLETQPPAPKATGPATQPKKAVARADANAPAVANAVASKDAVPASAPAATRAVDKQDTDSIATTVTGCLDLRDDGMFQLKDTDGQHAPKARSWKSGFIKRSSATLDVFDAGNRLDLGMHVGYRVSISGMLADRDMRARSMSVTSERCD